MLLPSSRLCRHSHASSVHAVNSSIKHNMPSFALRGPFLPISSLQSQQTAALYANQSTNSDLRAFVAVLVEFVSFAKKEGWKNVHLHRSPSARVATVSKRKICLILSWINVFTGGRDHLWDEHQNFKIGVFWCLRFCDNFFMSKFENIILNERFKTLWPKIAGHNKKVGKTVKSEDGSYHNNMSITSYKVWG